LKTKNPHGAMKQIQSLGGKAAVFVRGVMLFDESTKLREVQEAGLEAVRELGEDISVPYISKLTASLGVADILIKERTGRSFKVVYGSNYDEFAKWIDDNPDWGTTINEPVSDEVIIERSRLLDQMAEDGAVRVSNDHPLGKAAYMLAREKFSSGEYDMVFVKRDWDVMAVNPHHGSENDVTYMSSVSDQNLSNER